MAEVAASIRGAPPRYGLPREVFACRHGSHVIFLDLAADRYFAVDVDDAGIERHVPALIARGLLVADPSPERPLEHPPIEPPEDDLADAGLEVAPRLRLLDVWRFAVATAIAWLAIRCLPLGRLVRRVSRRRDREAARCRARAITRAARAGAAVDPAVSLPCFAAPPSDYAVSPPEFAVSPPGFEALRSNFAVSRELAASPHVGPQALPPFDLAVATRCAAVFERLQPLAFSARDACLFQCCAFLEFAARYRLYPLWVFGVQATPFAAHCWVQQGPLVLNDAAEHAAAFAQIMVA